MELHFPSLDQIIRVSGQAEVVMKSRWAEFSSWGRRKDKKFAHLNIAGEVSGARK